jgi:hypothetical protein
MAGVEKILEQMRRQPAGIRFSDLCRVCEEFFGTPRQRRTSHRVYRTPWEGDPRVNIQNAGGMAKAYQVRQVLQAIKRLRDETNASE